MNWERLRKQNILFISNGAIWKLQQNLKLPFGQRKQSRKFIIIFWIRKRPGEKIYRLLSCCAALVENRPELWSILPTTAFSSAWRNLPIMQTESLASNPIKFLREYCRWNILFPSCIINFVLWHWILLRKVEMSTQFWRLRTQSGKYWGVFRPRRPMGIVVQPADRIYAMLQLVSSTVSCSRGCIYVFWTKYDY